MTVSEEKTALRTQIIAARKEMTAEARRSASKGVVANLRTLPEIERSGVVHTFLPARSLHEVDIQPLVDMLLATGVKVVVPVVRDYSRDRLKKSAVRSRRRLEHCLLLPGSRLRDNRWGIPEPEDRTPVDIREVDIILVPSLACDHDGFRLGFGYGYYDEVLGESQAVSVCPCFQAFLYRSLPREEHDRPVDIIVTENSILRPNGLTSPTVTSSNG